ncbi:hypothetical protein GUJ93_ZPchr0013g35152 [Zizania palustris]|uniref:Uncharacterized protein n=1 Tax=Zizania palustris TaxID=103762 RepID=A0A8J5WXC3_ZIZPA|nr:hypothetical protein GUJ93_ZPchr0013g35152 [Zizania palustris]
MVTIDDYYYKQGLEAAIAPAPSFRQHAGGLDMSRRASLHLHVVIEYRLLTRVKRHFHMVMDDKEGYQVFVALLHAAYVGGGGGRLPPHPSIQGGHTLAQACRKAITGSLECEKSLMWRRRIRYVHAAQCSPIALRAALEDQEATGAHAGPNICTRGH